MAGALGRRNVPIWAALLVPLGLTLCAAYQPLGRYNVIVALGIARSPVGLLALFFVDLWRSGSLMRLAAAAGLFWLAVLFALTLSYFLTRGRLGLSTAISRP